jgi:hypothetical protein
MAERFSPQKLVKDRPSDDRRRRRASRVLDKLYGMKRMASHANNGSIANASPVAL